MAKSPEFRQACESWVIAVLKLFADRRLYSRPDLAIEFREGGYSARPILSPDYRHLTTGTDLMELDETAPVLHIARKNPQISTALFVTAQWGPPHPDLGPLMLAAHTMSPLMVQYLIRSDYIHRADRTSILPAVFDDVYGQLEQYIFEPETIAVSRLVQFRNLKTEIETVDFGNGIHLRRASEEE